MNYNLFNKIIKQVCIQSYSMKICIFFSDYGPWEGKESKYAKPTIQYL